MKITRVRATNFCCHEELDVTLSSGICGILGPNGSGKSSVLDAIRFGVTGESVGDGTLGDNVTWGKSSGSIIIDFEHGDTAYQITRTFGKKTSQELKRPDGHIMTRQAEIREYVENLLGTSMDALLNNVFVAQGQIDSILFSTKTKRLKEMQQTVGLQQAADAERLLGNEAGRYNVTAGLEQQIVLMQEGLEQAKTDQVELAGKQAELERQIMNLGPSVALLDEYDRLSRTNVSIQQANARVRECAANTAIAMSQQEKAEAEYQQANTMVSALASSAESAQESLAQYAADKMAITAAEAIRKQLDETSTSLDKLVASPVVEDLDQLEQKIEAQSAKLAEREAQLAGKQELPKLGPEDAITAELAELSKDLANLGLSRPRVDEEYSLASKIEGLQEKIRTFAEGSCPTCGQAVVGFDPSESTQQCEDLQARLKRLSSQLDSEFQAKSAALTERIKALQATAKQHRDSAVAAVTASRDKLKASVTELRKRCTAFKLYSETLATLTSRREMLSEQLRLSVPQPLDDQQVLELRELIGRHAKAVAAQASAAGDLRATKEAVAFREEATRAAMADLAALGELTDLPGEVELAQARLDAQRMPSLLQEQQANSKAVVGCEMRIDQYQASLLALQEKMKAEQQDAQWVNLCKRAREILHVTGLPALLMREYAGILNRRLDYWLAMWEAPFRLSLDEDMAFVATFDDGMVVTGARLSGGQKIVASTSFRLAMIETFAREVGLLILDEPSNHLDKENIVHLQRLMLKLKELTGSSGRQVILVDHEESLVGFLDNITTLEPL